MPRHVGWREAGLTPGARGDRNALLTSMVFTGTVTHNLALMASAV